MKKSIVTLRKKTALSKTNSAFSLIELSIVILIIGIVIAGIIGGNYLYKKAALSSARSLTQSSNLRTFRELYLWLETASDKSLNESDRQDGAPITAWNNISNNNAPVISVGSVSPTYADGGMSRIPAIRFNGNDSCYVSTDGKFMNGANVTILIAYQPEAANAGNLLTSGDTEFALVINQNGTAVQLNIKGATILSGSLAGYSPNVQKFIEVVLSSSGAKMYINKTLVASSSDTTKPTNISTLYIGRGYTGQIGELAILLK